MSNLSDRITKNFKREAALRKLRSFLDANEPGLVYFLQNLWRAQGKAITYKELREAILSGDIDPEYIEDWMQDYSRFVVERLQPKWQQAMVEAAEDIARKYPDWYFDPMGDGVIEWTKTRSADFVTSVTQTQIEGLRAVVQRAAVLENMSVDQLARSIRAMVGLTAPQARANLNYYEKLIESGVKEKKALDLSIRYSARQSRYRGYLIARCELSMAYNTGAHEGIKQAQAKGYMGQTRKIVASAQDERVCPICGKMEGVTVGMDEDFDIPNRPKNFNFTRQHPPFHYMCRCTVMYEEVKPPEWK